VIGRDRGRLGEANPHGSTGFMDAGPQIDGTAGVQSK